MAVKELYACLMKWHLTLKKTQLTFVMKIFLEKGLIHMIRLEQPNNMIISKIGLGEMISGFMNEMHVSNKACIESWVQHLTTLVSWTLTNVSYVMEFLT